MRAFLLLACGFAAGWAAAAWRFRRVERLRARMLSFVSHELNTPVTSLRMTVSNFIGGVFGPVPEEHLPWLQLLSEQMSRLGSLVGDLRDFIHLELHRDLRLNCERVRMAEVVGKVLAELREGFKRAEVELQAEGVETLPEVEADPERLERVFFAMLLHARKFRMRGPVRVLASGASGAARFEVRYEGPKEEPGYSREALELYYPARRPESQVLASTGLGLGLAARIAALHGGRLALEVDPEGRAALLLELVKT